MPGRFRLATWVINETRGEVYNGSTREANPLDERTAITVPLVSVDLRITQRLGVQVQTAVPFIARTGVVQRPAGALSFRDQLRGLGDTMAGVWYRDSHRGWTWTLNGGLSLPTGSSRKPQFRSELENGSLVPMSRLQRGSGTWDPLFGLSVEHAVAGGRWVTSLAARTPVGESKEGLRTGTSWEAGSGWAHTIKTHKVMGYARLDWLHRDQDVFQGTPVLVGGGDWLYASPGLAVMIGKGINLQAEVKVPIRRSLANRQLDSSAILQFGVSRSF